MPKITFTSLEPDLDYLDYMKMNEFIDALEATIIEETHKEILTQICGAESGSNDYDEWKKNMTPKFEVCIDDETYTVSRSIKEETEEKRIYEFMCWVAGSPIVMKVDVDLKEADRIKKLYGGELEDELICMAENKMEKAIRHRLDNI